MVFNTFYNSIEEKDNHIKSLARKSKKTKDNYSKSENEEFNKLFDMRVAGQITDEEFIFLKELKGLT